MRSTCTCPKCGCRQILYVKAVADGSSAVAHRSGAEAPAAARLALRIEQQKALIGSYSAAVSEGHLEAYVCRGCGYVEQHVADAAALTVDGDYIREHAPPGEAYR